MSETSASPSSASTPGKTSPMFTLVVLGLMLLIIATLAALWNRERTARITAQNNYAALAQEYQKLQQTVGSFLGAPSAMAPPAHRERPVAREDLTPQTLTVDGKSRPVFTISPKAGERVGFEPGDVIMIAPAASTEPAAK